MPRISVSAPTTEDIKRRGREYALLVQAQTESGEVDAKVLSTLLSQAGAEGKTAPTEDVNLSFDDFAAMFSRPQTEAEGSGNAVGVFAKDAKSKLSPMRFTRRAVGPKDVRIQIAYASICYSDVHTVKANWGEAKYPLAVGHEMVGVVTETGSEVTNLKVGDKAGVGCMVNTRCKFEDCDVCGARGLEQYCPKTIYTYNATDVDGTTTNGGYTTSIVLHSHFALRWPDTLSMQRCVPLLCAGITVYSPLKHFGVDKPGMKLGVVGLGGLGHCAVLFGKAMGMDVTVFSTSEHKKEEALGKLGADHFVNTKDKAALQAVANTLDGVIDTVSNQHDVSPYADALKLEGKLMMVGVGKADEPLIMPLFQAVFKRLTIGASLIGGIKETQEMLDFAAEKGIQCLTEDIPASYINEAYERMDKSDVKYRFVINVQGSLIA